MRHALKTLAARAASGTHFLDLFFDLLFWFLPLKSLFFKLIFEGKKSIRSFDFLSLKIKSFDCNQKAMLRVLLLVAGPQPRPSTPSVRCRTSTTTIHAQCSLPDLNHDHQRPVFAPGPQPRPSTPSVRCRTSTTTVNDQCSLPDLNSYAKSYAR